MLFCFCLEDVLTQGQEVDLIHTREREHQEVGGKYLLLFFQKKLKFL